MSKTFTLAKHVINRFTPEQMKWMWGQGLLMYALSLIDEAHGTDNFTPFISRYYNAHLKRGIKIVSSDTLAPSLGAYMLWSKTSRAEYKHIAENAAGYMHTANRILEHLPNHMGTGIYSKMYPKSIWVDSVMMYGVFAGRYSNEQGDNALAEFALRQLPLFEKYLRDEKYGLFYHSYWTYMKKHYPSKPIFWGRGNGWIMAAMPLMLPFLPEGPMKDEAIRIFRDLARALLPYQLQNGYFETLLHPKGVSYKESSATALIAAGLIYGGRTGILDMECLKAGLKAFKAVEDSICEDKHGLCLPNISAPTIPVPGLPLAGYLFTPTGKNLTYGLAALIFAALEAGKCQ